MNPSTILIVSFGIQATAALITAIVLGKFYSMYRQGYLHHWRNSWLALFVLLALGMAGVFLREAVPPIHPARLALIALGTAAGYLQIAWLLFGAHELNTGKSTERRVVVTMLVVMGLIGAVLALLYPTLPTYSPIRYFLRIGVRSLIAGLAFVAAAALLWRAWSRRAGLGDKLVSGTFLLYGIQQIHYFAIGVAAIGSGTLPLYSVLLGFPDFLLQFGMALGMVIWLLEQEREATVGAAQKIEHLAYHDALTGLPNRQLFLNRLEFALRHAHRGKHKLAVFFLDLDRFKVINDSLGHGTGDELLRMAGQRIRDLLREDDTVTRIGGDEFTILAPQIYSEQDAITVARRIRDSMKQPFLIAGRELFVTTSIGISIYPSDGDDPEVLLRNADTAMYRAKAQGRDIYQMYSPSMNARALEQLTLENAMRKSAIVGDFELYYQPIVDMRTGRIVSLETMLRWRHPELGLLLPRNFILLAEATGLIVQLGETALRTACTQLRKWQLEGNADLRTAVNLSGRQIRHPDFVELVAQVLGETGLAGESLELEITESIATHSDEGVVEKLRQLKQLGVRISIDDFGTGFSSLSALRLFPADSLKIDQSFVSDMTVDQNDAAIASAVIALARSLRLTVIAEGVETEHQLEFLRGLECDLWQGYLFSPPVPASSVPAMLARNRGAVQPSLPFPPARTGAKLG